MFKAISKAIQKLLPNPVSVSNKPRRNARYLNACGIESLDLRVMLSATGLASATTTADTFVVVGVPEGKKPDVNVFDANTGKLRFHVMAFDPAFRGGVNVATGDVNGDGVPDLITAAGPGSGPHVKVFSGVDGSIVTSFLAYSGDFTGGVRVAAGDVDGDGKADIITAGGAGGGPHVKVFNGVTLAEIASFFAYDPSFTGGVNVAAGDVNGDGKADIITGASTLSSHVKVFDGNGFAELQSFFAFDPGFTGGVFVGAKDITGDGKADLVVTQNPANGKHSNGEVAIFDGANGISIDKFGAYGRNFVGGVYVGLGDVNGDGHVDLVTSPGAKGHGKFKSFSFDKLLGRQEIQGILGKLHRSRGKPFAIGQAAAVPPRQ